MIKKLILGLFILSCFFSLSLPVLSQSESIVDTSSSKYNEGDYNLDDIVLIAIRASRWILGIVGSLTLLMFTYGGFMFLISAGSSDKINQAKNIIIAAVVGLIIVFTSYLIIKFILQSFGINWDGTKQDITYYKEKNILI